MTVDVSYDDGQTWSISKGIHNGPSAYSDMAVLPDDSILLIYEGGPVGGGTYDLIMTTRFNFEWLEYQPFDAKPIQIEIEDMNVLDSSGKNVEHDQTTQYSGGKLLLYRASEVGDFITLEAPVPPGTYHLALQVRGGDGNRAQMQVSVNGEDIGPIVDEYNPEIANLQFHLGKVTFTEEGNQTFKFTVTGKNAKTTAIRTSGCCFWIRLRLFRTWPISSCRTRSSQRPSLSLRMATT